MISVLDQSLHAVLCFFGTAFFYRSDQHTEVSLEDHNQESERTSQFEV